MTTTVKIETGDGDTAQVVLSVDGRTAAPMIIPPCALKTLFLDKRISAGISVSRDGADDGTVRAIEADIQARTRINRLCGNCMHIYGVIGMDGKCDLADRQANPAVRIDQHCSQFLRVAHERNVPAAGCAEPGEGAELGMQQRKDGDRALAGDNIDTLFSRWFAHFGGVNKASLKDPASVDRNVYCSDLLALLREVFEAGINTALYRTPLPPVQCVTREPAELVDVAPAVLRCSFWMPLNPLSVWGACTVPGEKVERCSAHTAQFGCEKARFDGGAKP